MNIYKSEKGITLMVLALTILVLAMITGVGIYGATKGISTAKDSKLMTEVKMVQQGVIEQYVKYKTTQNKDYIIGSKMDINYVTKMAMSNGFELVYPSGYEYDDYYKLSKADMEKLGFQNITDEYVVNYVSGEVMNYTHITDSKGNPVYVRADSFKQ